MNITVLDGATLNPGDNPWDPIDTLGNLTIFEHTAPTDVVPRCRDATVILTNKTPLDAGTLAQLPNLKLICVLATGYNVVDIEAAQKRGITVCNVPEYGTNTVAQFAIALLFELCHHIGRHAELVRQGGWHERGSWSFWDTPQVELAHKTIGILGYGRIGSRVGAIAHALGMKVLATANRNITKAPFESFECVTKEQLLKNADVISLHCPLTPETQRMVDQAFLAQMRPGSFLINTARGQLIDEMALAEALGSGHLGGAALDVASTEPLPKGHPLQSAPNCIITPHMAWCSLAARQRIMTTTHSNIEAFLGGTPRNTVRH